MSVLRKSKKIKKSSKSGFKKSQKQKSNGKKTRKHIRNMSGGNKGKIGLTYTVNIPRLNETIRESAEDGEPMENFINGILGVVDDDRVNYNYPDFFIYDFKRDYYFLSNGNKLNKNVFDGRLNQLGNIIGQPEMKLENKLIAKYLQIRDECIEKELPDALKNKIRMYRKATEKLHKPINNHGNYGNYGNYDNNGN